MPDIEKPKGTQNGARPDAMVVGSLNRYPRWGIRIHCRKTPDPTKNIIPRSANNKAYLLATRYHARPLHIIQHQSSPGPPEAAQHNPIPRRKRHPARKSRLKAGMRCAPLFTGFVTVEAVLVRLNTSYTPSD
ncbi:hypothetical protein HGRIS_001632 [Hohenbuehelia grisea]|uniref:Uncharacterized protein n=1 Tax=Hohenbuehelia grisea TaxID=104357 RepID=A0ABR3JHZ7_9AGAR